MWIRITLGLTLVGTLAIAQGCSAASRRNPRENLPESLRDFHNQLVWGRYADAAGYLPEDQRHYFLDTYDEVGDDMRFTEYELGSVDLDGENQEATVLVTLSWYRVPYYVVEETRLRETWALDEENDYWWLINREEAGETSRDESEARADGPADLE